MAVIKNRVAPKKKSKKSAAVKSNTQIALRGGLAPDVIDLLQKELNGLKAITDTPYKTSGIIEKCEFKTLNDKRLLVTLFGYIILQENAYNSAAIELGSNTYPEFQYNGNTKAEWAHDIKLRLSILTHDSRKRELTKLVEEGKTFLTKENQYDMYLKKVASTIKGK